MILYAFESSRRDLSFETHFELTHFSGEGAGGCGGGGSLRWGGEGAADLK